MLKERHEVESYIETKANLIIFDQKKCKRVYDICYNQYNVPRGMTADIIASRADYTIISDFILFAVLDALMQVVFDTGNEERTKAKVKHKLSKYYTESEIKTYSEAKYVEDKLNFPLKFSVIQITEDQWIGRIDVKTLMKMRKAQLIFYNTNSQRTMQKVIRGERTYYKIAVNKKAVKEIEESYRASEYIPNTITLNIPVDHEKTNYFYDSNSHTIVVQSIPYFDIVDGYHRYVAMSHLSDTNPEFNYDMELRLTAFEEEKIQRLIFQEDQKTKMKKIDSDSFNMNHPANRVVTRLNESSKCNIKGLIGRNEAIIPLQDMVEIVKYLYFKGVGKEKESVTILEVTKYLTECFNLLTEHNFEYIQVPYSFERLLAVIYGFYLYQDKDKENMCEFIDKLVDKVEQNKSKFVGRAMKKGVINEVEQIVSEVNNYV